MANRRSVLIGLGGLVAAGGAALGTGAFTTVTAERTVTVSTAGDASAFLQIEAADRPDDTNNGTPTSSDGVTANEYVQQTDGTVEINLDSSSEGASGLNQNAITTFRELVTLTNNGTQNIDNLNLTLSVSNLDLSNINNSDFAGDGDIETGDVEDVFQFTTAVRENGNTKNVGTVDNGSDILSSGKDTLTPGDTIDFGLLINLIQDKSPGQLSDLPGGDFTLEIEALTSESNPNSTS